MAGSRIEARKRLAERVVKLKDQMKWLKIDIASLCPTSEDYRFELAAQRKIDPKVAERYLRRFGGEISKLFTYKRFDCRFVHDKNYNTLGKIVFPKKAV